MADTPPIPPERKKKKNPPSRQARRQRRAAAGDGRQPCRKPDSSTEQANTALEKEREHETKIKRIIKWVKGTTINPRESRSTGPLKERRNLEAQTPPITPTQETQVKEDVAQMYANLEESYKLSRVEQPTILRTALRYLIRHRHPRGRKISFPDSEAFDRMILSSANLPAEPKTLESLVRKTYARRGQALVLQEVYEDSVRCHGRTAFDPSRPWPSCYFQTHEP